MSENAQQLKELERRIESQDAKFDRVIDKLSNSNESLIRLSASIEHLAVNLKDATVTQTAHEKRILCLELQSAKDGKIRETFDSLKKAVLTFIVTGILGAIFYITK